MMYSPICLTQVLVLDVFLSFLSGPRRLCCVFLLLCCRPQRLCLTLVSLVKWRGVAVGCAGGVGPGLRRAPSPAPRRGEPGRAGTGQARLPGWAGRRPAALSPCAGPRSWWQRRHPYSLVGVRGATPAWERLGILGKVLRTWLSASGLCCCPH